MKFTSASGTYLQSFQLPGTNPQPVAVLVDGSGNVYAADYNNNVVVKFNSSGVQVGQFGSGILLNPSGITTDGSGNFYVTTAGDQIVAFY